MANQTTDILAEVADYYSAKLAKHGDSAQGVDWNSEESQTLRFLQLSKIISENCGFSINDLGCGYGALYDYLCTRYSDFSYSGCDVSADMIRTAEARYSRESRVNFIQAAEPPILADYGIASGVFNVRLENLDSVWYTYIKSILDILNRTSRYGFAFNCLTSFSEVEKMHDYLYYANPCELFDLCKRRYSNDVALLHDYGLFEFTILVRKA